MPQAETSPKDSPKDNLKDNQKDNSKDNEELKKALEALLFITDHPLSAEQLGKLVGVKDPPRIAALVQELRCDLEQKGSAVQLLEIAEGFQMATRPAFAPFVRKLYAERMTMKLSTAAHETLSIIAYKQPLTRAEIEEIRGVEVIAALETLLEKRLLKVVGRKDSVGRPLMYGTTVEFLRHFGLKSLEELPPIDSFPAEAPAPAPSAEAVQSSPEESIPVVAPENAQAESVGEPSAERAPQAAGEPVAAQSAESPASDEAD